MLTVAGEVCKLSALAGGKRVISIWRLLTYNQRRSRDGLAAHALAGVLMTVEQRRQRKESFGSQSDTSDNQDEIASPPRTLQLSLRKSLSPSANVSASLIIRSPSHVDVLKEKFVVQLFCTVEAYLAIDLFRVLYPLLCLPRTVKFSATHVMLSQTLRKGTFSCLCLLFGPTAVN